LLIALLVAGGLYYRSYEQNKHLTEKDTIVLTDFANSTGDAIFEDTLRPRSMSPCGNRPS